MSDARKKLTLMISSTVYGYEELLDLLYAKLNEDYEVWMSHKGTVPIRSDRTALGSCLAAVEKCDLFLGIITPNYGSGQDPAMPGGPSFTHQEILKAIELKKPRWIIVHDHVVFARGLLKNLGFSGKDGRKKLKLKKNLILDDLRVLDLYEDAIIDGLPLTDRRGNWVQKFNSADDIDTFVQAQFLRYGDVLRFVEENFIEKNGNPLPKQRRNA